jgi:hypothetical protein
MPTAIAVTILTVALLVFAPWSYLQDRPRTVTLQFNIAALPAKCLTHGA